MIIGMNKEPEKKGWDLQFTTRAWRLLVIAVLLGIGLAANSFSPPLPLASLASTAPNFGSTAAATAVVRDTVAALAAALAATDKSNSKPGKSLAAYRRSAQVQLAVDELRTTHDLLLPVPGFDPSRLHNSFTNLRGDGTRRHYAIDIPAVRGTPVVAVEDGSVIQMNESKLGGITLYATGKDQRFIYFYAHLDHYHRRMKEGLEISRGDTLGFVGTTGNAAEGGAHLHFAIVMSSNIARWSKGTPINPFEVYSPKNSALRP
jgi:peptidoglycan LD-endopeptidase LytH